MNLVDFLNSEVGTAQFDWQELEAELGFQLRDGLKNFYSKAYERIVRGEINFKEADFLVIQMFTLSFVGNAELNPPGLVIF